MPKYKIKYVYERWYDLDVEAENRGQALDMFYSGEYVREARLVGGEIQADPIVEEIVNV